MSTNIRALIDEATEGLLAKSAEATLCGVVVETLAGVSRLGKADWSRVIAEVLHEGIEQPYLESAWETLHAERRPGALVEYDWTADWSSELVEALYGAARRRLAERSLQAELACSRAKGGHPNTVYRKRAAEHA